MAGLFPLEIVVVTGRLSSGCSIPCIAARCFDGRRAGTLLALMV